jgi:hypothetical protein
MEENIINHQQITKWHNTYQMATKYTKLQLKLPLQDPPKFSQKLGFLV